MRLLRRLILPSLLAPWLTGLVGSLLFGRSPDFVITASELFFGFLLSFVFAAVLLAFVLPLGLAISQYAIPVLIKAGIVVVGSAICGWMIVGLITLFSGQKPDWAGSFAFAGLFGAIPAAVAAAIWSALNLDFLRLDRPQWLSAA
jgi:hypothetical protein